jgi:hypothetical protein
MPSEVESSGFVTSSARVGQQQGHDDHAHAPGASLFQSISNMTTHQQRAGHWHQEPRLPHLRPRPEPLAYIEPTVDVRPTMGLSRSLESLGLEDAFKTGHGFSINEEAMSRMVVVERPSTSAEEREVLRLYSDIRENAEVRTGKVERILENNGYRIIARAGAGGHHKRLISFVEKDGHVFCIRHAAVDNYLDRNSFFRPGMVRLVTRNEVNPDHLGAFDKAVEDEVLSHMLAGVQVNKKDGSIERILIARLKPYGADNSGDRAHPSTPPGPSGGERKSLQASDASLPSSRQPIATESSGIVTPLAHVGQRRGRDDHSHAPGSSLFQLVSNANVHQQMASPLRQEFRAPDSPSRAELPGHMGLGVDAVPAMTLSRRLESLGLADAFRAHHKLVICEPFTAQMAMVEQPSTSTEERKTLRSHFQTEENAAVRTEKVERTLENNGYRIIARAEAGGQHKRLISLVEKDGRLFCIRHATMISYPDKHLYFPSPMTRLVTRNEVSPHYRQAFDKAVEEGALWHMLTGVQVNKEDGSIERIAIARLKPDSGDNAGDHVHASASPEPELPGHSEPGVDAGPAITLPRQIDSLGETDAFQAGSGFSINEESESRMSIVEHPSTSAEEREALQSSVYSLKNTDVRTGKIEHILEQKGYQTIGRAERPLVGRTRSKNPLISLVQKNGQLFCIRHTLIGTPDDRGPRFSHGSVRLVTRNDVSKHHQQALGVFDKAVEDGTLSQLLAGVQVNQEDGSIGRIFIARLKPNA